MSESLIPSFLVSDVSESLRSLTKNERCEQIAQDTHQKWATMSDSLTSLRGNERSWANCSGYSPKMSKWMKRSFFWANHSFAHFWAENKRFTQKTDEQIPSPGWYLIFFFKWGYCYWLAFNKLLDIKNAILGVFQGWAPHSFTFWMHRSFAFF